MIETWCTAKVSIPLKEKESFLLHKVITTTNDKPHFKLQLSENQQDKSNRTPIKINVKILKQNSWRVLLDRKLPKFLALFYIPVS